MIGAAHVWVVPLEPPYIKRLHQIGEMRFRVVTSRNEIDEIRFAGLKIANRKSAAKKFITQPDTIGVHHVDSRSIRKSRECAHQDRTSLPHHR